MQKRSIAEILTGLVVLAIAASFLGYAVTSTGRSFSGPGMNLTAKFDRIDGLGQGADVRIAGVKVGQVVAQRIELEAKSFGRMMAEPAAREAFTAFMEKRKPDFSKI